VVVGRDCKIEEKGEGKCEKSCLRRMKNLIGLEEDVEYPSDT